ncbi:MAG: isoleucine--tRNA ligase [Chloroflexi bacterium]|nr:isoleucine--tRNA ligase [Chloroflexota bacterium]MYE39499.1 isoleucine--tRNA ligase [Chloroflexota bacterium]
MFSPVSSRVSFPELDSRVLQHWKERDVFRRAGTEREGAPRFMLYDGPPTANGSPGIHHVLARIFKDVMCRYKTMKGYQVLRKGGWDTHGLPVELGIEQELGLTSKRDIEEYGIEEFNQKCKESVFRYVREWEEMTDRIGFWVDMDDPYVTLENDYIETGWWILKTLWDRGLLYQGMRGTPHCPRCVTSLSSHELALGYQEDTPDPSVFVKFRVESAGMRPSIPEALDAGDTPAYLLAWTTTPWTLPGNTALAVDADAEYSVVELENEDGSERIALASALVESNISGEHRLVGTIPGSDLVGLGYSPLYSPARYGSRISRFDSGVLASADGAGDFAPRVVAADFVSMEDGTGIVHIAPAFGDEDLGLGREKGLNFVQPVDLQGMVTGDYPFAGKFVKDADPEIMDDLNERGLLHHRDIYRHTYPFCWRCDTPLLYYAKSSWYIRTTALKDELVDGNSRINWYPEHIQEGRFGEWLRNNVDWAISRERYWGTPIPIWQCDSCSNQVCIGGREELKERLGRPDALTPTLSQGEREIIDVDGLDLHRPYVDEVTFPCDQCDGTMSRVPEVMDCWFDSGAMPFAQAHYPFENSEIEREGLFPADYICEAVDQTRGWFYSLHALSTLLKGEPSYKNVICLGLILDERGRKMSKRVGNIVEPLPLLDEHGADALRWYLFTASQPGEARRFSSRLVNQTLRQVLLTLWNIYSFFVGYAAIDKFDPSQKPGGWKPENELDRWVLSELNELVAEVDRCMENYDPTNAGRRIQEFVDRLSNWYVRRSRRRFWRSDEGDADKLSGYVTLHTCLVTVAKLMAPLAPFVSEEIYQNLVCSVDPDAPDSVHLAAFPVADASLVDEGLMEATRLAMRISSMGRAARSKSGLKVRQPLASAAIRTRAPSERAYVEQVRPQILDELNIKDIELLDEESTLYRQAQEEASGEPETTVTVGHYTASLEAGYMVAVNGEITPALAEEGLARELVHRIQGLRRAANFEVTDHIETWYDGPDELAGVMRGNFSAYIREETLSDLLEAGVPPEGAKSETAKVEGQEITLAVRRV